MRIHITTNYITIENNTKPTSWGKFKVLFDILANKLKFDITFGKTVVFHASSNDTVTFVRFV